MINVSDKTKIAGTFDYIIFDIVLLKLKFQGSLANLRRQYGSIKLKDEKVKKIEWLIERVIRILLSSRACVRPTALEWAYESPKT